MFRFTIRDVLWLTVVVALGLAWWIDRSSILTAAEERVRIANRQGRNPIIFINHPASKQWSSVMVALGDAFLIQISEEGFQRTRRIPGGGRRGVDLDVSLAP